MTGKIAICSTKLISVNDSFVYNRTVRNFSFRTASLKSLNLFGNFSFRTGYFKMRCSKSYNLYDFELDDLGGNKVSEQVPYFLLMLESGIS